MVFCSEGRKGSRDEIRVTVLPFLRATSVMPRFLQKGISENFQFSRDITTSLELRFDRGILFFLKNLGILKNSAN